MLDNFGPKQLQDSFRASARNLWLASLGAFATVEQESSQLFDQLVSRGRKVENRGWSQVEETMETAEDDIKTVLAKLSSGVEKRVAASLHQAAVPTRKDVDELGDRVERLTRLVGRLEAPATPTEEERRVYHVTSHEDGWKVQAEGAERASRVTETKASAVAAARELGQNQEPNRVVVHRLDGTIQTHHSYGE